MAYTIGTIILPDISIKQIIGGENIKEAMQRHYHMSIHLIMSQSTDMHCRLHIAKIHMLLNVC